jgi:hypothetical protein
MGARDARPERRDERPSVDAAEERYLELRADFDNLRRRAAREREAGCCSRAAAPRSRYCYRCSTRLSTRFAPVPLTTRSTKAWPPRIASRPGASRRRGRADRVDWPSVRPHRARGRRHDASQRRSTRDRGPRSPAGWRPRRHAAAPRPRGRRRGAGGGGPVAVKFRDYYEGWRAAHRDRRGHQARLPAAPRASTTLTSSRPPSAAAAERFKEINEANEVERSRQASEATRSARTGRADGLHAASRFRSSRAGSADWEDVGDVAVTSSRRCSGAERGGWTGWRPSRSRAATSRPS